MARMRIDDEARLARSRVFLTLSGAFIVAGLIVLICYLAYKLWRPRLPQPGLLTREARYGLLLAMVVFLALLKLTITFVVPHLDDWAQAGRPLRWAIFDIGLAASAVAAFWFLRGIAARYDLNLRDLMFARINTGKALLLAIGAFCVLQCLDHSAARIDAGVVRLFPWVSSGPKLAGLAFAPPLVMFLDMASGSILAPVMEEIFHRGVLFRALRARMGFLAGAALGSLVFALGHSDPLAHVFTHWCMGMVACVLVAETGSLVPGMMLHCLVNTYISLHGYLT